ncbi:MAG: RNA 2'-phosphotransferase [Thermodesulfobacteriota bacterium]
MKKPEQLARFLSYALGLRPDEFGLVPEADGSVSVKELLAALSEDPEWRWVRRAQINEVLYSVAKPPIVLSGERIRAAAPPPPPVKETNPPKLLFTAIRERAYPLALDEGYRPSAGPVVLSGDSELARRMGKRRGKEILLAVNTARAMEKGMEFLRLGELLFLSERLVPGTFSGPALPKPRPEKAAARKEEKPEPPMHGSFFWQPEEMLREKTDTKPVGGRKKRTWKEERRKGRWKGEEE